MKKLACTTLLSLAISSVFNLSAQTTVIGRVLDFDTKKPVKEAVVSVIGTNIKTQTNVMGYFELAVDSTHHLHIESKEYESIDIQTPSAPRFQILVKSVSSVTSKTETSEPIEVLPEFPGGMDALMKFLKNNMRYPEDARRHGVSVKIFTQFIVDSTGSIPPDSIRIIMHRGQRSVSCEQECIRLIKKFPKWTPGTVDGKPVSVRYILPLSFELYQ